MSNKAAFTMSNINPKDFESEGTGVFNTGLQDTYTANVPTTLCTLTNKNGVEACITNLGARLVSLVVPDKFGNMRDVVLGFDNIAQYADYDNQSNFFGAVIGRYANRLTNLETTVDGKTYKLTANDGEACLHGGPYGWAYQTFIVEDYNPEKGYVTFVLNSPDGDEGFAGNVTFKVTYSLSDDNALTIKYEAETDKPTVINVTNHTFFNLFDPRFTIFNHLLFVNSKKTTPIKQGVLPTGEIVDIEQYGPLDFYTEGGKLIGTDIRNTDEQIVLGDGFDHNFILEKDGNVDAKLTDFVSGISMEVTTTEPALQIYASKHLDASIIGKKGVPYNAHSAVCIETQHYPDSPAHDNFPSTNLEPGEKFESETSYKFVIE